MKKRVFIQCASCGNPSDRAETAADVSFGIAPRNGHRIHMSVPICAACMEKAGTSIEGLHSIMHQASVRVFGDAN